MQIHKFSSVYEFEAEYVRAHIVGMGDRSVMHRYTFTGVTEGMINADVATGCIETVSAHYRYYGQTVSNEREPWMCLIGDELHIRQIVDRAKRGSKAA